VLAHTAPSVSLTQDEAAGPKVSRNIPETSATLARLLLALPAPAAVGRYQGGASVSADVEELVREGLDRLAAVTEVPPGLAEAALRRALHERVSGQWLAAPPAVTLIVGLWGVTARPYWGDKIDTVSAWRLHALHVRGKDGRGDRDQADNQQPTEVISAIFM
jgi:hypothetical protein